MARPYFKKRIDELEAIFGKAGNDPAALETLRDELAHRKTRRAIALSRKVRTALEGDASGPAKKGEAKGEVRSHSPVNRERTPVPTEEAPESPLLPAAEIEESSTPELSSHDPSPAPPKQVHRPVSTPAADSLLAAWITLEVLEPQPLPKPRELEAMSRQMIRADEHPEPWNEPRYGPKGRQKGVYWFVHLGELDLSDATGSLLELFSDDSPEKPRPVRGTTPLAVAVLDGRGRPAEGKVFLSSFAWGYGRVRVGALGDLAGFPAAERRLCEEVEERLTRMNEDGEVLPVTAADLDRVTRWLIDRLRLPPDEVRPDPVCVRVPVWRRVFEAPEPELLNSFFLEDLDRVRSAFRSRNVGRALNGFFTGEPGGDRTDVVRDPAAVEEALSPARIPLTRWPVRGRYPLVMMQQAAVDHSVRELSEEGLVGINGPPGTGKTTLLRDVVAKVVLDRSIAMAAFRDPQDAFHHVTPISAGRGFLHLYALDESLRGHEIVVASSNNKAVENISREIPAVDAVASDLSPPLRYFASVADRVLQGGKRREPVEAGRAWGLAAAVLGNAANRREFVDAFWWDPQRSMHRYLRGIVDGWDPEVGGSRLEEEPVEPGMEDARPPEVLFLEGAPRDRGEALARWRSARKRFREALKRAEEERGRLESAHRALRERSEAERAVQEARERVEGLRLRIAAVVAEMEPAERDLERARRRLSDAVADREALTSLRPGLFARLFRTARFRGWRERMADEVAAVREAREVEQAAEDHRRAISSERDELERRLRGAEANRKTREERLEEIRALLLEAQRDLGERLPDRRFWALPEEERQKLSPWLSERFQAARDDLFRACFELHRAFADAAAPRLRHNLGAAMMLLKGRKLSAKQEPARRSLWASLFLVIPVLSTTFASVARMFGPLGREQLGWLLIDEAGQAVPQAAVGAIWRSRRVIGIGDPMQIPPVVTMPQRLTNAIMAEHGVDPDAWSAPRASVQSLADRASWFGTTLLHEDGDVWVGSPLRVHRRCEQPMFRISNQIAYDGLMVQATPPGASAIGSVVGESGWFHLAGSEPGHWSPSEGEVAARLLDRVLGTGIHEPDIFFITPFRLVRGNLRKRLRRVVDERTSLPPWRWVQDHVGTIHTFQGKEAEAVVLVLGAPSPQAAGARFWAGGQPNLLNVAVSRAKRRLYVIGDRQSWRSAGVFRTLAACLPERELG